MKYVLMDCNVQLFVQRFRLLNVKSCE
jgi:hypothetical protein